MRGVMVLVLERDDFFLQCFNIDILSNRLMAKAIFSLLSGEIPDCTLEIKSWF